MQIHAETGGFPSGGRREMEIEQLKETQVPDTTQVSTATTANTETSTAAATEVPEEFSSFFAKASAKILLGNKLTKRNYLPPS